MMSEGESNHSTREMNRRVSRRSVLIAGGVGAVAALGGLAYVAARFSTPPRPSDGGMLGAAPGSSAGAPGGQQVQRAFKGPNIRTAPEIPSAPPEVQGIFRKREDNSLFLGTGNITVAMPVLNAGDGNSAGGEMIASADGPEVEVVVTRKTRLFRDTTPITMQSLETGAEIQQTIEPVESLDALTGSLGKADALSVWGTRNGDRYVATVILYRPPVMLSGPA
jgi:hypothetical protein